MRVDVHQHFWSAPLVAALERREELPLARRDDGAGVVVRAAGEVPARIDIARERPDLRVALLEHDGIDRALIALSSPLAIEALPRAQAQPLIDAYLDGALALGERFSVWGPVALDGMRADDVDAVLARGCVGVSLPAGALSGRAAVAALAPALARLEALDAPLFVHPGPGLGEPAPEASAAHAAWWAALTTYVWQMQAAWLSFVAYGRPAHPRLRVVFAMLAGNAPLLGDRLAARGGPPVDLADPLVFYETSSFGEGAIGVLAGVTGAGTLLYGSDRPVVEPHAGAHVRALAENGAWLVAAGRDGCLRG
jgi:6-methylsalicylate decarboxylase